MLGWLGTRFAARPNEYPVTDHADADGLTRWQMM
jgi:hypothetical protein